MVRDHGSKAGKLGTQKVPPRHGPNLRDEGSALEPLLGLGKRKAKGAGD
jgi:hypothetical protein